MGINRLLNCLQVFCGAISQSNRKKCDVFMLPVAFFYIFSARKGGDLEAVLKFKRHVMIRGQIKI